MTHCVTPKWSRRSMNSSWPWSRLRCTQPDSRAVRPGRRGAIDRNDGYDRDASAGSGNPAQSTRNRAFCQPLAMKTKAKADNVPYCPAGIGCIAGSMTLITDNGHLAEFCRAVAQAEFVAVDTEFMREKTYWPILCLVQIAGPDGAAAIDPLAPGNRPGAAVRPDGRSASSQGVPCGASGYRDFLPSDRRGAGPDLRHPDRRHGLRLRRNRRATRRWPPSWPAPRSTNRRVSPTGRTAP